MLICNCCGKIISEDSLSYRTESRGYTSLGNNMTESYLDDECSCGGDFVEASKCPICGNYYNQNDDAACSICEDCFKDAETLENAILLGSERCEEISINEFFVTMLGAEKINEILIEWAKNNLPDTDPIIKQYCQMDDSYFADWIKGRAN